VAKPVPGKILAPKPKELEESKTSAQVGKGQG